MVDTKMIHSRSSDSNSIYLGLIVSLENPITNQKRYDAVLNEVLQLLQTHKDEINIELIADRFIVVNSQDPSQTDIESVILPLTSIFLHTSHFKIHSGGFNTQ